MQALLPAARLQLDRGDHALALATARRGAGLLADDRLRAVDLLTVQIEALLALGDVVGAAAACDDLDERVDGVDVPALTARRAKRGETLPEAPPISRPAAAVPAVLPDPGAAEDTTPAEQHVDLSGDPVTSVATSASDMPH